MNNNNREKIRKEFQRKAKQVSAIFQKNPSNIREEMEKLGFMWVDDGDDEMEQREEENTMPKNNSERRLVEYFEGKTKLSNEILKLFLNEKRAEETNFPLFRKYFKKGNHCLKKLLLYGLQKNPTDHSLLMDLVYFNEFHPNITELKDAFINACQREENLDAFEKLVRDFWTQMEPLEPVQYLFVRGAEI